MLYASISSLMILGESEFPKMIQRFEITNWENCKWGWGQIEQSGI